MKYGKYGNIHGGTYDISKDLVAINELVEKELISEASAQKRIRALKRDQLLYIVATNGGYAKKHIPSFKKDYKKTISEMTELFKAQKSEEIRQQLLNDTSTSGLYPTDVTGTGNLSNP